MSTNTTKRFRKGNAPVEAHLIQQALLHRRRCARINLVLSPRREVVALLDLVRPHSLSDTDHPEELVDIVARVADEGAENDEDVVDVVFSEDGVGFLFGGGHGLSDGGNVGYESRIST